MGPDTEGFIVNTIIGEGTEFKGEFKLKGLLRIDGTFTGVIETEERVLIGKTGRVHSDVYARNVVVGGEVIGNLYATEKVTLLSTARIRGDIHTPRLVVEEGVIFEGACKINEEVQVKRGAKIVDPRD